MSHETEERNTHQAFGWLFGHASKLPARRAPSLVESQGVPQLLSDRFEPFVASIVATAEEILGLKTIAGTLVSGQGMLDPRFFLATVSPRCCRPCVVVVSQGSRIAGILYARERMIAGIPTGIVLGDDTLGTMVAAHPQEMESVLHCAVAALLKHKAALRFRVAFDRLPLLHIESAKAGTEIRFYREQYHAHLELPRTYDQFLFDVRRSTRHNLYRYRRRSESAGNFFRPDLLLSDFCLAAKLLFPKGSYLSPKWAFHRALAMIRASPSRFLVGLRRRDGDWISLAGGWYAGDCAFLALQLNDRTCARESVSLVLRSYLIEHLIGRGIRKLVFWGGTSAPLSFYAAPREEFTVYIDSRSHPWRLVRLACVTLAKFAPATFGRWLKWETSHANEKMSA
jgi:hypothetical protein